MIKVSYWKESWTLCQLRVRRIILKALHNNTFITLYTLVKSSTRNYHHNRDTRVDLLFYYLGQGERNYRVCRKSNVSEYIVNGAYITTHLDRLIWWKVKLAYARAVALSFPTICSVSRDLSVKLHFIFRASHNAALVRSRDCHQVFCETRQVRSVNISCEKDLWW